jgi:hypothetical protein
METGVSIKEGRGGARGPLFSRHPSLLQHGFALLVLLALLEGLLVFPSHCVTVGEFIKMGIKLARAHSPADYKMRGCSEFDRASMAGCEQAAVPRLRISQGP